MRGWGRKPVREDVYGPSGHVVASGWWGEESLGVLRDHVDAVERGGARAVERHSGLVAFAVPFRHQDNFQASRRRVLAAVATGADDVDEACDDYASLLVDVSADLAQRLAAEG